MIQKQFIGILLVLSAFFTLSLEVWACRFNVRETGFVDLGVGYYHLFYFVDSEMSADDLAQLETLGNEVLAEHSIVFGIVPVDQEPDHPALRYLRSLEEWSLPAAVLVSPTGDSFWLGPLWEDVSSIDQVRGGLESVYASPVRSRIAEELSTAFAVVLLFEGQDEVENGRARTSLLQAIETLEAELEYFPKPIKKGPVLVSLGREELTSERVLLWSFGVESGGLQQPIAAILYGRGRWIGPLMIGDEITLDLVARVLFIVGADCECDLDPRLLRGTGIPLPWNNSLQEIVSRDLGFDPDNPLVRMEVSQIMKVNSWQAAARDLSVQQIGIPVQKDDSGVPTGRLFSFQFLYLIGGLLAVVVFLGLVIWIRAANAVDR